MLKQFVIAELKKRFHRMEIEFGGVDTNVIARIPPVHASWKPILIRDDGHEVTVFYGDFTHDHYKYYGVDVSIERQAKAIAEGLVAELEMVFDDQIEFWRTSFSGGMGPIGSLKAISYAPVDTKATLWSGKDSH